MRTLGLVLFVSIAACGNPAKPTPATPGGGSAAGHDGDHPDHGGDQPAGPPRAAERPTTDRYHGVDVVDRYQWLEGNTAEVEQWSDQQNAHAERILGALPGRATLAAELRAIIAAPVTRYRGFAPAGAGVLAMRKQPTKQQAELIAMTDLDAAATATLVLDPTAGGDPTAAIDWFVPSPDGQRIAVSVSSGGSEAGALHVIDRAGKDLEPIIPNVQRGTGGGDAAWSADGKTLFYTRYPAPGEKPADEGDFWLQVWSHQLGQPIAGDRLELGTDLPKIAEIRLEADATGRVLATVQNGDGGTFRHYLRSAKGGWRQLTDWNDAVVAMTLGARGSLWLVSTKGAPRGQVLTMRDDQPLAKAKRIVAEGTDTIVTSFSDDIGPVVTADRLFLSYQQGGPSTVRAFTLAGKPAPGPKLPPVSSAAIGPRPFGRAMLVWSSSYVQAPTWSRLDVKTGALTPIAAVTAPPVVDLSAYEVRRELATSADGTQVPLNIVWRRGAALDGTTPCLVTGYGGYGLSLEPFVVATRHPLLTRGVCFVEVNLRGGGEFGEAWHQAGALTHKQNVFDDMAAALGYLIAQRYTSADRIVIEGGSNGGLLMGAVLTQHPELVKAVVSHVGIYDMLRVELSPNGLFNTTEFGTVVDPAQFAALHAYSPYHHVTKQAYPAVLMTTGANDPRVAPWHSRKMIAALQAAHTGAAPILLRTSKTSGHGMGTAMDERIAQLVDTDAFILAQLGITP